MAHALLSASKSSRWLNCTKSARLEESFEDTKTSESALEGTAAHELCEYKLKKALGQSAIKPESKYHDDEMKRHSDDYVGFILEIFYGLKKPIILIEQKLDFSKYVPDGFGTGDVVIVSDKKLHVIDLKYGQGILVKADFNPQMMLYAVGALELFDFLFEIEEIEMTIYQPRKENISSFIISKQKLLDWAEDVVRSQANLAFEGEGYFKTGEWCTFCKAAAKCRQQADEKLSLARHEFALPPTLTDKEIEEILPKLNGMTKWADEVMNYATNAAINQGKVWNGYKLVEGRSIRKFKDEKIAEAILIKNKIEKIYKTSMLTLAQIEKMLGSEKFNEILGEEVIKPKGKLTLVPEKDKIKK